MLKEGLAVIYFIFPNISPFVNESIINSVPCPDEFFSIVNKEGSSLYEARKMVKGADKRGLGVFDKHNPSLLLPFELRFLCDRSTGSNRKLFSCEGGEQIYNQPKPLHRYVIDMSKDISRPVLRNPSNYYDVKRLEDRLFIPDHFVPLFKSKGYDIEEIPQT
jgi:hypothetical protein